MSGTSSIVKRRMEETFGGVLILVLVQGTSNVQVIVEIMWGLIPRICWVKREPVRINTEKELY